jgi:hypothetical protein
MNWHKLSEEKPTEVGTYLFLHKVIGCVKGDVAHDELKSISDWWLINDYTHWLKIEPPKEDK